MPPPASTGTGQSSWPVWMRVPTGSGSAAGMTSSGISAEGVGGRMTVISPGCSTGFGVGAGLSGT